MAARSGSPRRCKAPQRPSGAALGRQKAGQRRKGAMISHRSGPWPCAAAGRQSGWRPRRRDNDRADLLPTARSHATGALSAGRNGWAHPPPSPERECAGRSRPRPLQRRPARRPSAGPTSGDGIVRRVDDHNIAFGTSAFHLAHGIADGLLPPLRLDHRVDPRTPSPRPAFPCGTSAGRWIRRSA